MPSERIAENLVTKLGGSLFVNLGRPQIQEQGEQALGFQTETGRKNGLRKTAPGEVAMESRTQCIAAGDETRGFRSQLCNLASIDFPPYSNLVRDRLR